MVLFPSHMRPPEWLRSGYECLDEETMSLGCTWGVVSRLEEGLIWASGLSDVKDGQRLNVWYSKTIYKPGVKFSMFGSNSTGEVRSSYALLLTF